MCMGAGLDVMSQEYMRRNPGVEVTSRTGTDPFGGSKFDFIGRALGRQALAAGVLDEGVRQPQFGSTSMVKSVSVTKKGTIQQASPAPRKASRKSSTSGMKRSKKSAGGGSDEGNIGKKTLMGA